MRLKGFIDLLRGRPKRHYIFEIRKILPRTKVTSYGKELPNDVSCIVPNLLSHRATKEHMLIPPIVGHNGKNSCQSPLILVCAIYLPPPPCDKLAKGNQLPFVPCACAKWYSNLKKLREDFHSDISRYRFLKSLLSSIHWSKNYCIALWTTSTHATDEHNIIQLLHSVTHAQHNLVLIEDNTFFRLITLFKCRVVLYSIFSTWHGPPLSYIHGKKLTLVWIMDSANMESKNIVDHVGVFSDSIAMNNIFSAKTIISQNLISRTNMLSPITFTCPTWRQPKHRLQLQLYKMWYPRHFYGVHLLPHTKCNVHIMFYGVQVSPMSAANSTWKWPSWHCQHIICLHGAYMSSMCPSLGTMENHVSCDVT